MRFESVTPHADRIDGPLGSPWLDNGAAARAMFEREQAGQQAADPPKEAPSDGGLLAGVQARRVER